MTTITRFTKEQLIEQAKGCRMLAQCAVDARPDDVAAAKNLALAEIALASLDAGSDSNNHPAHGPLSDYRLHRIREILGKAAAQSDGGNIGYAMSDAVKAIDELLAGRKAEPVAWRYRTTDINGNPNPRWSFSEEASLMGLYQPLYTAPPAPVVQCPFPCGWDNLNKYAIQDAAFVACGLVEGEVTTEAHRRALIMNNDRLLKVISACRAAMLQGDKS